MKKLLLLSLSALTLISCSQQQFAFRKKVNANQPIQAAISKPSKSSLKEQTTIVSTLPKNATENLEPFTQNSSLTQTKSEPINEPTTANTNVTIQKKDNVTITEELALKNPVKPNTKNKANDEGAKDTTWASITGFILSLVGWFILPVLFCTGGIVLSAIGLKSKKKGMAIAGLVIGIVGLILGLILAANA